MANTTNSEYQPQPQARQAAISPKISSLLQREPSQQELEVARHLVEHSQSVQPTPPSQESHYPRDAMLSIQQMTEQQGAASPVRAHYDSNGSARAYPQPSPAPSAVSAATTNARRSPTVSNVPAGQQCRYVMCEVDCDDCANVTQAIVERPRRRFGGAHQLVL